MKASLTGSADELRLVVEANTPEERLLLQFFRRQSEDRGVAIVACSMGGHDWSEAVGNNSISLGVDAHRLKGNSNATPPRDVEEDPPAEHPEDDR